MARHRSPSHHMKQLTRRRSFLKTRIEDPDRRCRGGGDFDRSEYIALCWAIDQLEGMKVDSATNTDTPA